MKSAKILGNNENDSLRKLILTDTITQEFKLHEAHAILSLDSAKAIIEESIKESDKLLSFGNVKRFII